MKNKFNKQIIKALALGISAKAAAPVQEEQGKFPWWIIVAATIAGVSVEEYLRRKKVAAKATVKKEDLRKIG